MSQKEQCYTIQMGPVMLPTGVDKDGGAIYTVIMEPREVQIRAATLEYQKNGTETMMLRDLSGSVVFSCPLQMLLWVSAEQGDRVCNVVPMRPQLVGDMGLNMYPDDIH